MFQVTSALVATLKEKGITSEHRSIDKSKGDDKDVPDDYENETVGDGQEMLMIRKSFLAPKGVKGGLDHEEIENINGDNERSLMLCKYLLAPIAMGDRVQLNQCT